MGRNGTDGPIEHAIFIEAEFSVAEIRPQSDSQSAASIAGYDIESKHESSDRVVHRLLADLAGFRRDSSGVHDSFS
jgi:hypothetical protein